MPSPSSPPTRESVRRKTRRLTWTLLLVWALASFGWVPFARDLDFKIMDWPFSFWMAAQGSVLVFLLITVVYAWLVNRWERALPDSEPDGKNDPA